MNRRVVTAALAATVIFTGSGCLTLFSKTEVVRSEEPRRPIAFEDADAAKTFNNSLFFCQSSVGGAHVGVPFLTLYSRQKTLSKSAVFNDAVARCDTDQNGTITKSEADIFASFAGK